MPRPLLWFSKLIDDCVTPESKGDGIVYKVTDNELHYLIKSYILNEICNIENAKSTVFPGSQPCSIFANQLNDYRKGEDLFMVKSDGVRQKFFSLHLYSNKEFIQKPKDKAKEVAEMTKKLNPIVPENPNQIISLVGNHKKYNTKAKRLAEEKEKKKMESKMQLEKEIMDSVMSQRMQDDNDNEELDEEDEESQDEEMPSDSLVNISPLAPSENSIKATQIVTGFISRSWEIYILSGVGVPESLIPLIMDGELIFHKPSKLHHFQVFHVDVINSFSCKEFTECDRIMLYHAVVSMIQIDQNYQPCINKIIPKRKESWCNFPEVYNEYKNGNQYDYDGILSEKNWKAVSHNTNKFSKKIKTAGSNTFDLRTRILPSEPSYLVLLKMGYINEENGKLVLEKQKDGSMKEYIEAKQDIIKTFSKFSFFNDFRDWDGQVIEYSLDYEEGYYYAIKTRSNDKITPNSAATIEFTKQNIRENVTPESILELWHEEFANIPSLKFSTQSFKLINYNSAEFQQQNLNYFDKIMKHSNWDNETITNKQMPSEMMKINFSWELNKTKKQEHSINKEEIKKIEINYLKDKNFANLEQMKVIFDFKGLKNLNKKTRKRGKTKKKETEDEEDEEAEEDEDEE